MLLPVAESRQPRQASAAQLSQHPSQNPRAGKSRPTTHDWLRSAATERRGSQEGRILPVRERKLRKGLSFTLELQCHPAWRDKSLHPLGGSALSAKNDKRQSPSREGRSKSTNAVCLGVHVTSPRSPRLAGPPDDRRAHPKELSV